jgi:formylglycine-generating enzyme required for sulfatase activity
LTNNISGAEVDVAGRSGLSVSPTATTTYTLTAMNATGSATATTTVSVGAPPMAGDLTFQLPDTTNPGTTVPLVMKAIPGGTFLMGRTANEQDSNADEDPQHSVTVSPFYMGIYLVTQAQWVALMGSNPSNFIGDPTRPVEQGSWNDISQTGGFLDKLNAATAATRPAGMVFRLPTEAEWEYAARAGTTTRFYWGDDPSYAQIGNYAWYSDNSGSTTHPVGQKLPNAFGLYDMAGNVWEWCADDWHGSYAGAPTDGSAWVDSPRGSSRLLRGGCWDYFNNSCRSAGRGSGDPSSRVSLFGFRVVLGLSRTP